MFCPHCGKQIPDNSAFCTECGGKLDSVQAVAADPVKKPKKPRKSVKKGLIIGIIAALLAIAAATAAILILTSPGHKLKGTWVCGEEDADVLRITFKAKSVLSAEGEGVSDGFRDFTWEIGRNNKLRITVDGDTISYTYGEDGKDDADCWYIDGNTLYLGGVKLTKSSGGETGEVLFNVRCTKSDVKLFMNKVCQNTDAKSAKVKQVEKQGSAISAKLEVRLRGGDAETVQVTFFPEDGSRKTGEVIIGFYEISPGEYNCARAVILGLEETLGGSSSGRSLKPYDEMTYAEEHYWFSDAFRVSLSYRSYSDEKIYGSYSLLTDEKSDAAGVAAKLAGSWYMAENWADTNRGYAYDFFSDGSGREGYFSYTEYEYYPDAFHYSVDADNTLTVTGSYGLEIVYLYSRSAMSGDYHCWYTAGSSLYLGGVKYQKSGSLYFQLAGSWRGTDYRGKTETREFFSGGTGRNGRYESSGYYYSSNYIFTNYSMKYSVDSDNTLTINEYNGNYTAYDYSAEAKYGSYGNYWYLEDGILYVNGTAYTKS